MRRMLLVSTAARSLASLPALTQQAEPVPPAVTGPGATAPAEAPSAGTTAGATTPAPAAIKDSSLAPAPIDIQLDVPALPGGESLVATPKGDSAMKRILRAVNGGKDLPQRP